MILVRCGYHRCAVDRQLFRKSAYRVLITVHADDLLVACPRAFLEAVKAEISRDLLVKWSEPIEADWQRYLGKLWRRTQHGFAVRMSNKFFKQLLDLYQLDQCRPVAAPNVAAKDLRAGDSELLEGPEVVRFRSAVGKLLWLSHVRPDVSYLAKELARHVQKPCAVHVRILKSVLRFLKGTREAEYHIVRDPAVDVGCVCAWVDASWGSDFGRRSTSGGFLYASGVPLTHWARTQPVITTSSCESELLAVCAGAQEALLVANLCEEIGLTPRVVVHSDSKSALDWLHKKGVGRLKHIELRQMWIQEAVMQKRLSMEFIQGADNIADLLTKTLSGPRLRALAQRAGMSYPEAELAMLEEVELDPELSEEGGVAHGVLSVVLVAGVWQITSWSFQVLRWIRRGLCEVYYFFFPGQRVVSYAVPFGKGKGKQVTTTTTRGTHMGEPRAFGRGPAMSPFRVA